MVLFAEWAEPIFPEKPQAGNGGEYSCAAAQAPFLPVPQRESLLALIFPQPDSIHFSTILRSYSSSPALGTTMIPTWAVLLTPQICMQVASFHCHAPLQGAVLPYLPWMKDWGPPHNLSAMVPEPSLQHRAFNLGYIMCCTALSRELDALEQGALLCSWPRHPMLSLNVMSQGSLCPAPQVCCETNPQLHCDGAMQPMQVHLWLTRWGLCGWGAGHESQSWGAWDGSLCSSWTLSLHCLQTVKLNRHLQLLSVSVVSFLNHVEKKPH